MARNLGYVRSFGGEVFLLRLASVRVCLSFGDSVHVLVEDVSRFHSLMCTMEVLINRSQM